MLTHGKQPKSPISDRPGDDGTESDSHASPLNAQEQHEDGEVEGDTEVFDQKGGRSNRASHSGATGEQGTSGRRNKPEPRNQDEKGMGHPRNR